MEWLNIHVSVLRSPEFIGSDPIERATWLCVLGYSVEQENGGRIVGAALWKDRQWQQACGVTAKEVRGSDRLLRADGNDILVNGYPTAKESQVRQARSVAYAGAMARWGKNGTGSNADRHAEKMPTGMPDGNAEGKGREGKGTGREQEEGRQDLFDQQAMDQARAIMAKDAAPMPPAPPQAAKAKTFSDWRAMHPDAFIGRNEREDWEALFRLYEYDAMAQGYRHIQASKPPHSRIFLTGLTAWLTKHYELTE